MTDADLLPETLDALARQLDLGVVDAPDRLTLDDVRRYLEDHVARLLDRNPSLLMSILYRVDVAERDVQRVLREAPPPRIPARLAELLIERQLLKVRVRRAYRQAGD